MTHPHTELITRFYEAFQVKNAAGMVACYDQEIHFSDAVFPDLRGVEARSMWSMLCAGARDLKVEFSAVNAGEKEGSAHWEAWYTFSQTGRPVHNVIEARFQFKDGRIVRHADTFDFWRWSRQALGPVGLFLGWSSVLKGKVRSQAARSLQKYMKSAAW